MSNHEVYRYGAEGEHESDRTLCAGSLDVCRAFIAARLGDVSEVRRWAGTGDDVEAYHEKLENEPDALGCGGYAIRPANGA